MVLNTDIVIIGGGIAGLWTLNRLKKQGYNVILLESEALGSGQTVKSQGIIHGGLKYALNGDLTPSANALSNMPAYWKQCLSGKGEIDLSSVKVLSNGQYMWSLNMLTGIANLFASAALHSHVQAVTKANWPSIIRDSAIKGKLYQLSESVLNIPSLITALANPNIESCIKIDNATSCGLETDALNNIRHLNVKINKQNVKITAQKYIFTAGAGNKNLSSNIPNSPSMQLRPLHMVLVKNFNLAPIYGHCVGLGATPRITITTHIANDHTPVWYLGGKLAEDGVELDSAQQIIKAKEELAILFPKLDLSAAKWASFYVDRAEHKQDNGSKPNSATVFNNHNAIIAWPTKLALAPILSDDIIEILKQQNILPQHNLPDNINNLPQPQISTPIWDQLL